MTKRQLPDMQFDSAKMIADVYDEQVRSLVGSVVQVASGATMLLMRGRTIRDFRSKLAELSDAERTKLTERYTGIDGKKYETDSWRGLWDQILDTAYAMDASGNHRARAMSKYGEFLDIAEAVEARSPDAVPKAIVTYSKALTDLQRRVKNAELDRDRAKLLSVIASAFVEAFTKLGGKRRITGTRADAEVIDAALVALCAKGGIDVACGVVPMPKPRTRGVKAQKRTRDGAGDGTGDGAGNGDGEDGNVGNSTSDNNNGTGNGNNTVNANGNSSSAVIGDVARASALDSPKPRDSCKTRKVETSADQGVLECFEKMKEKIGNERAVRFVEWLVKESHSMCSIYPDLDVKDLTIINNAMVEEEEFA